MEVPEELTHTALLLGSCPGISRGRYVENPGIGMAAWSGVSDQKAIDSQPGDQHIHSCATVESQVALILPAASYPIDLHVGAASCVRISACSHRRSTPVAYH